MDFERGVEVLMGEENSKAKFSYATLFWSVFKVSAFTFGGGFVIIPLIQKRFVNELHWIEEEEVIDLAAIAQSSPGPIGVNFAVIVGYRVAGVLGAVIAAIGAMCPPLIIISVISLFYQAFRDNRVVNMVMAGMLAAVAAVIFDVVINMVIKLGKGRKLFPFILLAICFVALRYFKVNIILVILICGVIGALQTMRDNSEASIEKAGKGDRAGERKEGES